MIKIKHWRIIEKMPIQRRDLYSGAIIFNQTPDEEIQVKMLRENKELKKEVKSLKDDIMEIKNLLIGLKESQ